MTSGTLRKAGALSRVQCTSYLLQQLVVSEESHGTRVEHRVALLPFPACQLQGHAHETTAGALSAERVRVQYRALGGSLHTQPASCLGQSCTPACSLSAYVDCWRSERLKSRDPRSWWTSACSTAPPWVGLSQHQLCAHGGCTEELSQSIAQHVEAHRSDCCGHLAGLQKPTRTVRLQDQPLRAQKERPVGQQRRSREREQQGRATTS